MLGFRGDPPGDLNPAQWVDTVKKRVLASRSQDFPMPSERDLPTHVPPLRGRDGFTQMLRIGAVVFAVAAFALSYAFSTR